MSTINLALQQASANLQRSIFRNTQKKMRGSNLFQREEMLGGYNFADVSGALTPVANVAVSGYIPVDRNVYPRLAYLARKSVTYYDAPVRSLFFDKDFNSISSAWVVFTNGECEIQANAAYFRFSFNTQDERYSDAVVRYATQPASLIDPRVYDGPIPPPTDGNLIDVNADICKGVYLAYKNSSFLYEVDLNFRNACTTYIPVEADTDYIMPFATTPEYITSYLSYIYEFDKDRNFLRVFETAPFYHSSNDCAYVAMNYVTDQFDYRGKPFYLYKASEFTDAIGRQIATARGIRAFKTDDMYAKSVAGNMRVIGLYEKNVCMQRQSYEPLHFSTNGITGPYHKVAVNSTNFPNLPSGNQTVQFVLFFNTTDAGESYKCLVIFANNKIYTSTDGTFTAFEECDVWDVKGNHNYHIADNDIDPTGQRFRAWFPSDVASRQNAFMWHNGPVLIEGAGGQYGAGVVFGNYTNAHGNIPCPSALYYTKDGKNIYKQYEFGIYQYKYKLAGDAAEKTSKNYGYGDTLDVSGFTGAITSVSLKKRWNILPTAETFSPADLFEYSSPVAVSAISGGVATVADASGLAIGDTVILQGTATGDFAKILNNSASATVGGEVVFVVKAISGNNVTLADAVGNPKNNLMCRHIHGVSIFGQGFCVYTGEEYPESWFMYFAPKFNSTNISVVNDASWTPTRLNSGANAHQRSLGVYLRKDGKMIAIADSPYPFDNRVETVDGAYLKGSNFGVHVFDVKDINDAAMSISKIPNLNAGYALYYTGGLLFFSDYHGKTYVSRDEGDTWEFVCQDGTSKNILVGFDHQHKRYVFNTLTKQQFVIEID